MRIDCPRCRAAFVIDDRKIAPRGVRAQCPRCGEKVVVRPGPKEADSFLDDVPAPPPRPPAPRPPPPPRAPPPQPADDDPLAQLGLGTARPGSSLTVDEDDPFGESGGPSAAPPAPRPAPPRAPPPPRPDLVETGRAKDPFESSDPFSDIELPEPTQPGLRELDATPPAGRQPARPAPPAPALELDIDPLDEVAARSPPRPPPMPAGKDGVAVAKLNLASRPASELPTRVDMALPAGAPPAPPDDPFGNLDLARGADLPGPALQALPDPDAQRGPKKGDALLDAMAGAAKASQDDGAVWTVKRRGQVQGPFTFAELRERVEAGELKLGDKIARGEDSFRPATSYPTVANLFGRARGVSTAAAAPRPRWPLYALLGLLLVGAGAYGVVQVLSSSTSELATPAAQAYEKRIAVWALASGDSGTRTAEEHYQEGRKLFLQDTAASLNAAQEEFRRAVVKNQKHILAAAGWVEARAVSLRQPPEGEVAREASDVISYALEQAPLEPAVHRAYSHLLLATESNEKVMEAREHAQRARELSSDSAEALMVLGRTYIRHNADQALEHLDAALAKDPSLKRAYVYRGLARERVGRYAAAVEDFRKRLELDPEDRTALEDIARVSATVGAFDDVRGQYQQILGKNPGDPGARLGLAVLAYQVDGDSARAQKALEALLSEQEKLTDELRGRVLAHAAALAREAGKLERAEEILAEAKGLGVHAAPALYQAALVALERGKPADAESHLPIVQARITDDVDIYLLQGRIRYAAGDLKGALEFFNQALAVGGQRIEPPLHLAALQVKRLGLTQALGTIRRAAEVDPAAPGRPRVTDYYESTRSALRGLDEMFLAAADDEVTSSMALTAAGIALYHRGDKSGADKLFKRTLAADPMALPALVYQHQLAMDRGDSVGALGAARAAVQSERFSPIGHYLEGRALERRGDEAAAQKAYAETLEVSPTYPPALWRMGELARKSGDNAKAQRLYLDALTADRTNSAVKLELFRMGH